MPVCGLVKLDVDGREEAGRGQWHDHHAGNSARVRAKQVATLGRKNADAGGVVRSVGDGLHGASGEACWRRQRQPELVHVACVVRVPAAARRVARPAVKVRIIGIGDGERPRHRGVVVASVGRVQAPERRHCH